MKTKVSLFLLSLLFSFTGLQAQSLTKADNAKTKKEKILEKKLEFFKKNLELTPKEAAKFEKAYMNYAEKKQSIRKTYRKEFFMKINKENFKNISNEEALKLLEIKQKLDRQANDLDESFAKELIEILPPNKVLMFYQLNRKFNKKMIQRLKHRKMQNRRREMRDNK